MKSIEVSVIIRTFNEENNIVECLSQCLKNNPLEIIVVDGGSYDNTVNYIKNISDERIKLIKSGKGLAIQRDVGIKNTNSSSNFIAIVDADDRLDVNCLKTLIQDLEINEADAAQAKHESISLLNNISMTYWENAMSINLKIIRDIDKKSGEIEMIGRPALYRKQELLKVINFSATQFTKASEDSDLAYKLRKNGCKFTTGNGITYRKHLKTFRELIKRWLSYGEGDSKFVFAHPERFFNVLKHLFYTYPVKRALYCAKNYNIKYSPFFILQGIFRFVGMIKHLIVKIALTKRNRITE